MIDMKARIAVMQNEGITASRVNGRWVWDVPWTTKPQTTGEVREYMDDLDLESAWNDRNVHWDRK